MIRRGNFRAGIMLAFCVLSVAGVHGKIAGITDGSTPAGTAEHFSVRKGLWKVFEYETPDKAPIVFSGWSKAHDAHALEYCIYIDVYYTDGTISWGRKADFSLGTHDWEEAKGVFVPKKPVKKIEVYALFRSKAKGEKAKGAVKFRDFSIERREGKGETFSTFSVTDRPFSCTRTETKKVFKGREFEILTVNVPDTRPVVSPVPAGKTVVWTEDSMRLVTPLTFPSAEAKKDIRLALAKRESESAQILVSTATNMELCAVALELPVLRRKDGTALSGRVDWRRQGYLAREHGARKHPYSFPENERWFPDPLLPPAPMRVRSASTQGMWLTVYASPDALPGEYKGTVVVRDGDRALAEVPMSVTVRNFSLSKTFGLETAFSLMDGFTRAIYPECFKEKKREAIDIMLDHRLNPDDISRTTPPKIEDLIYARSRGMNRFNILNIVPPPKNPDARWVLTCSEKAIADARFYDYFVGVVKPYVEKLREQGLDKLAYVYGFDESTKSFNPVIERFWKKFQKDVPGIPIMTTAKSYQDFVRGKIKGTLACDWFCPTTEAYDVEVSERLRKEGKKVWWYVCCSPVYPYANFASWEYPPIEGRILGWMTHLYRADGFLFWIVNKWHGKNRMNGDDTYFPSYRTRNGSGMPGDGIMMYPGEKEIWPSIRLAQCRDGVEDYEYLQLAAAKAGVSACDNVTKAIVRTRTDFSRSPEELRMARDLLSSLIGSDAE